MGNSYTAGLPDVIADLAKSLGDSLIWSDGSGGQTIKNHAESPHTIQMIQQGPWDYVVIQCQSQEAAFNPTYVQTNVFPYAKILADTIRFSDPCAKPIFYMTWGRKNGDQTNCVPWPPMCTFETMQMQLRKNYLTMANNHNAFCSPVGMAWRNARQYSPSIELYDHDESHPSQSGVYLTACTFYSVIFGKSAMGATYTNNIPNHNADSLQYSANKIVFDSLSTWNIKYDTLSVSFSSVVRNDSVQFTSHNTTADSVLWEFGDGTRSSILHPLHVYPHAGHFTVNLTLYKGCNQQMTDTIVEAFASKEDTITNPKDTTQPKDSTTFINTQIAQNQVELFPNPANETIQISLEENNVDDLHFSMINLSGVEVLAPVHITQSTVIDIRQIEPGFYLGVIKQNDKVETKRLLISR